MGRTLSTIEIAQGLRNAGFPEDLIPTMTAVTLAESSGNPYAHNPNRNTGDNSYGLLQINMIDGMGPERRAEFGIGSNEALFDPATNFRAAKQIYDQQGIGAWGAYTNGSYKRFMGADVGSSEVERPRAMKTLTPGKSADEVVKDLPLAAKMSLAGADIDMAKTLREASQGRMAGGDDQLPDGMIENTQQQLGGQPTGMAGNRDDLFGGILRLLGL